MAFIKVISLHYIQLPQLYALEASSDEKDISRIKMAFTSKSKEYGVINYDNAVWDDTYHFINNQNTEFTDSNFVTDTYKSLGINGINIYDKQAKTVWRQAWDLDNFSPLTFPPFDSPSAFVTKHILVSEEQISTNNNKPVSRVGFTFLNDKIILFAATSIFQANLTGSTNGTMLFWRFFDEEVLTNLQQRAGIDFTIELVQPSLKNTVKLTSKNVFINKSYRTKKGEIYDVIPLVTGNGGIKFTYKAPIRQFSTSWLNQSTITSSMLFLLTLFMLFIFFHYFIIRPILRADKMVTAIVKHNDHSIRFSSKRKDELGTLFNLIDRLLDGVESKEQQLISHNIRLQHISQTDSLTKIPNRRAFDTHMKKILNTSSLGLNVSMMICDVDYFKKYNDSYGHAKGDEALYLIAQALRKNLHEETDFVARYGGEEFVVVLKNTNEDNAIAVANNLINIIADLKIPHIKSDIHDSVTISIGIHTFVLAGQQQYMPFFERADEALYQAKEQGRNRAIAKD
ncbi:sensor domain-containing diguanylate cyclase [Colwellia sp. 12G3]|uniref:sensor domain-containing diguanylate cyclase n=1 Tax=Colwellia sp. 12G3 TaxID=2058299 RepID=UPI0018E2ABCF|nr:diguanylate cyclase [Colwellia sp. 12G3]